MRSPYNAWGVYDMAPVPLRGMGAVAPPVDPRTLVTVLEGFPYLTGQRGPFDKLLALLLDKIDTFPNDVYHPAVRVCHKLYDMYKAGMSRQQGEALAAGTADYLQGFNNGIAAESSEYLFYPDSLIRGQLKHLSDLAWSKVHPTLTYSPFTNAQATFQVSPTLSPASSHTQPAALKPTDKCPPGTAYTLKGKCISAKCAKGMPCNAQSVWDAYQCKCVSKSMLGPLTMEGGGGAQTIGGKGAPGSKTPSDFTFTWHGPPRPEDAQGEGEVSGEGTPEWLVPALIGGALLVGVVAVVAIKK